MERIQVGNVADPVLLQEVQRAVCYVGTVPGHPLTNPRGSQSALQPSKYKKPKFGNILSI